MIAIIRGEVLEKLNNSLVVGVGGVGYEVFVSASEIEPATLGQEIALYIYDYLRENTHDLYGFAKKENKYLFEQLLSVKNIGPKVALAVMDIGAGRVKAAIAGGEVKILQTAKGVGKRAAEQMIVELRDRIGAFSTEGAQEIVFRGGIDQNDEAMQALVALGFSESDAHLSLQSVDKSLSTEERVRVALKGGK